MGLGAGTAYAITVQSHTPGIACSVSNGSGTVGSSDVTGIGVSCSAGTERIIYSFGANATDGQEPYAGVIIDSAGNLYGTTQNGGTNGVGTGLQDHPPPARKRFSTRLAQVPPMGRLRVAGVTWTAPETSTGRPQGAGRTGSARSSRLTLLAQKPFFTPSAHAPTMEWTHMVV